MEWIIYIFIALVLIDKLRSFHIQLGPLELNLGFTKSRFLKTEAKVDSIKKLED